MRPKDPNHSPDPGASADSGRSYDILRLPVVLRARGRSRTMHYHDIRVGLFTKPVSIGLRAVGWPSSEVDAMRDESACQCAAAGLPEGASARVLRVLFLG